MDNEKKQFTGHEGYLARRRRIGLIKKLIIGAFLALTLIPSILAIVLICKVNNLNNDVFIIEKTEETKRLQYVASSNTSQNNSTNNDFKEVDSTNVISSEEADDAANVKRIYLTFDDGPSKSTDEILDILRDNNVKATFFVVGKEDEESKRLYKRIVDEGHTIGMHSYSHQYSSLYTSVDNFSSEVQQISDLIYDTTGVRSFYFRFPGGSGNSFSNGLMPQFIDYLTANNIKYYDWNALNGDAVGSELSVDTLINNIMNDVRKNNISVVLMHDLANKETTVQSLQPLIDLLKEEGYEILPIDENTPLVQQVKDKN